jgi:hypothetical protein
MVKSEESPAEFGNQRLGHARREVSLAEVERIRRREGLMVLQRQTKRRWLSNRSRIGKYRAKSMALSGRRNGQSHKCQD